MKTRLLFALITVLCVPALQGEDATATVWWANGKPAPDSDFQKSKGGFGVELALVPNAQFFDDWKKPDPPVISNVSKTQRNVAIYTAVIFADPGVDNSGAANVTCDIVVKKPDGSIYASEKDVAGWQGKYNVADHNLQLARSYLTIRIEPKDPLGNYTVEVLVKDHIKKVEIPLKAVFEAVEINYEQWMTDYYKSKDPTAFPGALAWAAKQGLLAKEDSLPVTSSFFGEVVHEHPDLVAKYLGDISSFPKDQQKSIAMMLWSSNTDAARAVLKKSKFKDLAAKPPIVIPELIVTGPDDLDRCWGHFLASGDTDSLRPIISSLDLGKYAGSADAYKTSKKTGEDQQKAWLDVTWQSAMWSLESNARQHPLVMQYIEEQLRGGKLPKDQATCLVLIMSKLKPDLYKIETTK